jgi:hypothetical protein
MGIDITTAPAETITVTASFTITESASCLASSSSELPPIYVGPTTTTTTSSSISACATPTGQFLIQLDSTNLYLTGENGGPVPEGDTDQRLVTTSDEANAIAFSAATDGNGQVTFVSEDGTTLFSDQDAFLGSGDGPMYWDNFAVSSNGDYFPVQFCLQPDDTFVVQNRLGTDDPSDDANVVQICPDSALYLHSASVAASPRCNTVRLRLVQLNPSYPVTSTSSTTSATPSSTSSPSPSVSACVPVPDGQEFRVSVVGSSEYLTGADGGNSPVSSDGSTLVTTTDYSQAIPFRAALGKNGQITLLNVDGTTLYSDQDLTGSGDEPIYFDTLQTSEDSSMYPVQFCLQSDNTFVVQNLGTQDPNDDASIVQICPGDGAVYLHTASAAAIRGCNTVRLQIADAPPPTIATTTSTSSAAPTATGYKEGRYRVRMAAPGTPGYMTSYDGNSAQAAPSSLEANFQPTTDLNLAVIFETVPGQSGKVLLYNTANSPLYLNRDNDPGGPVYVNTQTSIDVNQYLPILFFIQQDDTIIVQNLGVDRVVSPDDSSTILLCPSQGTTYQMYAGNNGAIPSDCVAQTLIAEFVEPDGSTTSTSVSSRTPPPYVPPVGCPASSVRIPDHQLFRLKSTVYPSRWLSGVFGGSAPESGDIRTTDAIGDAVQFTVTPGETGQISFMPTGVYRRLDSAFTRHMNDNQGYLYFDQKSITKRPAVQFCLQPDNTFAMHTDGTDGPGANDPYMVVVCSGTNRFIYLDNGSGLSDLPGCVQDTMVYDPVV